MCVCGTIIAISKLVEQPCPAYLSVRVRINVGNSRLGIEQLSLELLGLPLPLQTGDPPTTLDERSKIWSSVEMSLISRLMSFKCHVRIHRHLNLLLTLHWVSVGAKYPITEVSIPYLHTYDTIRQQSNKVYFQQLAPHASPPRPPLFNITS